MSHLNYTTDEYVTERDIRQFIECAQLSFFVKEHDKINDYILSFMLNALPVPNRQINVTVHGKPPQSLEGVQSVFNILIEYSSIEEMKDSQFPLEKRIGNHYIYAGFDGKNMKRYISITLNMFKPDDQIPNTKATGVEDDTASVQKYFDSLSKLPLKNLTAEEIGKVLLDSGVNPLACEATVRILIQKGFIRAVPNVSIARINGKIDFMFGNHEFAESFSLTENSEELDFVYAISTPSNTGRFVYSVENQKETEMYIPKTTIQILKPIYRDRLEKAGLSEEAIRVILDEVFHGKALKAPKEDSSFVILSGKDVLHIYYSHNNKAIGMVNIEATKSTQAGDVIDYSVGIEDATFIVDTSNAQEKLIHRHLGIPKVKLELSSGYSVDIPFKKTYEAVTRDQVLVRITCDALVSVSAKVLENLTGPALADLQGTQADRYFVRGNELTEEVFRKRAALAAGDWTDIE